jgi:uncharacterized protein
MRGVAFFRDAFSARRFASAAALAVALALMALSSASSLHADPTLPAQTGRITDEADLLKPEDRSIIDAELTDLEQKSSDQVALVTLKSLQGYTIEDFGIALGRKWGIGQKGKDNGILLIVAPNEHRVRIEVGRRLEPFMTDLMSKLIIENAITPAFRKGDYAGGIKAGVRDIKDVLLGDAEAVKERAMGPRRTDRPDTMQIVLLIFWICVVLYILYAVYRSAQAAQQAGVTRSRRRGTPVFIPGSSGNWGSGWSGGGSGGDSGGGWSGGGGDFGGGGASGSW